MNFNPREYQKFIINKVLEIPKFIMILDMGLG